jgi:tRNA(Phe) wybutosine-synthesizing methylase Tyw3
VELYVNEIYNRELIEELIDIMKEAGDRLHKIYQEIKELRKKWCGEVVVII